MKNTNYNASDLFIKALENEGVEYIYGIPGEENLALLEAIRKSSIKLILNRHEQSAGFMASTYGRMTSKVGVALSTLGPGATNFTTCAAYATLGGFPLLLITGQKPIKSSKQGRFQVIDAVSMMRPITKYTKQIVDANMITSTIREAFRIALEEKPGAVHIEFPEDISEEEVSENTKKVFAISEIKYPSANKSLVLQASTMIKNAKMPLILIGTAGSRNNISTELTNLIDKSKIPFFNTQMGKGIVCEKNPHFIGTASLSSKDYLHEAIKQSDLIINIGYDVVEKPAYFLEDNSNTKVIHINYFSASVDNIYNPSLELVGDIADYANQLAKELEGKCNQDFSYAYKVKNFIVNHINEYQHNNSFPIKPQRLVCDIQKVMQSQDVITLDNGMYKLWFTRNYTLQNKNTLLVDNSLATMGAGLPSAIEVARLYPHKKVLAVVGDGGFMMNSQELETAKRLNVNLVVLILNDCGYEMIRWKQNSMGYNDYGLNFNNPDFIKYAQSYGCVGHRLDKVENFIDLLTNCFEQKGIHIIDVAIDYSENKKVLTDELNNKKNI